MRITTWNPFRGVSSFKEWLILNYATIYGWIKAARVRRIQKAVQRQADATGVPAKIWASDVGYVEAHPGRPWSEAEIKGFTAPLQGEKGFVLVAVLLVLVLMTALSIAMLQGAMTSTRSSAADMWDAKTFYAADGMTDIGLANLDEFENLLPGQVDTIWNDHSLGRLLLGRTFVQRVDDDSTPGVRRFTIYGEGYTVNDAAGYVSRTALDVTVTGEPPWDVWSGLAAMNGTRKNGNSGKISGLDACGAGDVPGLLAGDTVWNNTDPVDGSEAWLEGNPPVKYMHQDSLMAMLGFDEWKDVRHDEGDYVVNSIDQWPYGADWDTYPVIQVKGGVYLNSGESGKGVLIAPANLDIGGGFEWDGIILVGNELRINGDVTVSGSVLTALNMLVGEPVYKSDLGNGTKTFQFNMCSVRRALVRLNSTVVIHSWREIW
jgi:hypothetical protein